VYEAKELLFNDICLNYYIWDVAGSEMTAAANGETLGAAFFRGSDVILFIFVGFFFSPHHIHKEINIRDRI